MYYSVYCLEVYYSVYCVVGGEALGVPLPQTTGYLTEHVKKTAMWEVLADAFANFAHFFYVLPYLYLLFHDNVLSQVYLLKLNFKNVYLS